MKKQLTRASLITAAVFPAATGCGLAGPEVFSPPVPIELTLGNKATKAGLPEAVKAQVPSVLSLTVYTKGPGKTASASAVKVAEGVLTSGHVFKDKKSAWEGPCFNIKVNPLDFKIPQQPAEGGVAAINDRRMHGRGDIAYMPVSAETARYPAAAVSKFPKDLSVGQEVFFVNYQPTAEGEARGLRAWGKLREPAIYSGFVLQDPNGNKGQISILTGKGISRNYGRVPDTEPRAGASGGAIFAKNGQLVGITTAVEKAHPLKEIEWIYEVDLRGDSLPSTGVMAFVQPVNQTIIRQIAEKVQPVKGC